MIRHKIDLKEIANKPKASEFVKIMFQRRIDKTQGDLGDLVKNCKCKNCYATNILIYNISMLGATFGVDELYYDQIRSHKVKKK